MCYGDEAAPPEPPGPSGPANGGEIRLVASDGNVFLAYQTFPADRAAASGVVILPDVRGLHGFYRALADRFAEAGIAALAIDYYGRSTEDDERGAGFDGFAHVQLLKPEHTAADVRAAVDYLSAGGTRAIFTVGFCVGGAISWSQSAVDRWVAGAIGFYGRPSECRDLIPRMTAPLLVLAAGDDMLTPADEAHKFDRELSEHGVKHTFKLYDGAPHSFFDGGLAEHADACADAWRRVLAFVRHHTEEWAA
nr:dienelactone hydrolase family protein [Kibdelosporangium sp. MJ126-NF4]CEL14290.1 Dienelactone hydrolase family [Kibdelosporangium sp. MJ126-NF4]CTQ88657.1 Dienelactone hydrolase family [Kibdelosporangium sp. MJ126-NF4]